MPTPNAPRKSPPNSRLASFATSNRCRLEKIDAVSLAVPTKDHCRIGCRLLDWGIDVLVEKPMAASLAEADGLIASAQRQNRILQIGHLERFNPAVAAALKIVSKPMFFEVHRLGVFTPAQPGY